MTIAQPFVTDIPATPRPAWLDSTVYPFQSCYLTLDGHRLHYIDEGQGPTLLFLHANPLWSFQYRHIIAPLRAHFRCVAIDYPGFGLSEARPDYISTLEGNSLLVEQFIQVLALQNITLVAHDASVSIGLGVVVRHRDWFRALILSNGFAWHLSEDPDIYNFIRVVASPFFGFMIRHFNILAWYTTSNLKNLSEAERQAYLMPFAEKSNRHHQHDLFRSIVESRAYLSGLMGRLSEIRELPTLLAFADNDPTYKAGWLQRYEGIFPNHTSVRIEGSHHFPQEYNPQAIVKAIEGWWEQKREATETL